jgi:uncharacterized membrane protein (DUF485 family)
MVSMDKDIVERPNRYIRREIKLTMVALPLSSFLFGVIISFMYVNIASGSNAELTLLVFGTIFGIPFFIMLISLSFVMKKIFKQIDMMEVVKT